MDFIFTSWESEEWLKLSQNCSTRCVPVICDLPPWHQKIFISRVIMRQQIRWGRVCWAQCRAGPAQVSLKCSNTNCLQEHLTRPAWPSSVTKLFSICSPLYYLKETRHWLGRMFQNRAIWNPNTVITSKSGAEVCAGAGVKSKKWGSFEIITTSRWG